MGFPPLALVALRFAIVASLVIPFCRIARYNLPKILLLSFTMGTLHFTLLVVGVSQIDAGTAGVLIQLGVPFATILAVILYKEKAWSLAYHRPIRRFFGRHYPRWRAGSSQPRSSPHHYSGSSCVGLLRSHR